MGILRGVREEGVGEESGVESERKEGRTGGER